MKSKNQTEYFHKGTTCNHDPVTTQKETAFPNSCNTKSPTPPTAVLTAVMALSSLLWAAARSFRCWLLLFIAVLSSSAVCLTVSQTAQNQKLDPTISEFSFCENNLLDCLLVVQQRLWSESGDSLLKDEVCNCPKDWLISVRQYAATAASDYISCTAAYSLHLHITVRLLAPCSSDASICITPFPFAIYSQSDFCAHPEKTNRLWDLCQTNNPIH